MSLTLTEKGSRQMKHDRRSLLAVTGLTILALLLGAILKSYTQNQSQHIERKGVTALVPANWVVEEGVGDFVFASWDPFVPDVRYTVFLTSTQGTGSLPEISLERNLALEKVLDGFKILEETPIIRRGREGYKVMYAFIDTDQPGLPLVLQGVDYYFPAEDKTIIISLQAHEQDYGQALIRFEAFLDSVSYR